MKFDWWFLISVIIGCTSAAIMVALIYWLVRI
jgi:hypothetical protein